MSRGSHTYRCDRCPLILELGGYMAFDEQNTVYLDHDQVACAACGTMHRIIVEHGRGRVTALPGPVREMRMVIIHDMDGTEVEVPEIAGETEWQAVGPLPDGFRATDHIPCNHCPRVGRMLTLADVRSPGGITDGSVRNENCPVCGQPMECIAISD